MESCQGNLSHVHSPEFIPVTREIEDAHCPSLLWNWSTATTCLSVGLTHQNHIEWKVVLQSKIGAILKRKHDKLAHENTKFHDFMKPLFHFSSILFPESQFCKFLIPLGKDVYCKVHHPHSGSLPSQSIKDNFRCGAHNFSMPRCMSSEMGIQSSACHRTHPGQE